MMNFPLPMYAIVLIVILALVELALKGVVLWKSGRNNDKAWFIAVLLVNTAGILPLVYLLTHKNQTK